MSALAVRRVTRIDEEQHRAETRRIYAFLVALHLETGIKVEPDYGRAMLGIYEAIRDHVTLVAEEDGEIVGSIGLISDRFWYSNAPLLHERWFFIRPDRRGGRVLELLLESVAAHCDELGAFAEIKINNPHRRRVPRTRLERIGEALSFQPRGAAYVLAPAEETA